MSFKNQFEDKVDDSLDRLMCAVAGCTKRWSLQMGGGRPMCSEHQWAEHDAGFTLPPVRKIPIPTTPAPQAWWNKNED